MYSRWYVVRLKFDSISIEFDLSKRNSSSFCCVIHLFYCRCYCSTQLNLNFQHIEKHHRPKCRKFTLNMTFCVYDAKKRNHHSILIVFSLESNRALLLLSFIQIAFFSVSSPKHTPFHSLILWTSEGEPDGMNLISVRTFEYFLRTASTFCDALFCSLLEYEE